NFAVLKKLPILFVCENNQYAIHTHQRKRQGTTDTCGRARAFGMPAERIENNDVLALVERSRDVVAQIRSGDGPWFLEVMTYRWTEHVGPGDDFHLGFRDEAEARPWRESDQVRRLAAMIDAREREQIEQDVELELKQVFEFAEESPYPNTDELLTD